jgi:hypothetical protein
METVHQNDTSSIPSTYLMPIGNQVATNNYAGHHTGANAPSPMERWEMETGKESPWNSIQSVAVSMNFVGSEQTTWGLEIETDGDGTWVPSRNNDNNGNNA